MPGHVWLSVVGGRRIARMGKRRRRRTRAAERTEIGGMPLWALIGSAILVLGIGVIALVNMPRPVEASAQATPRTDFSFGSDQTQAPLPVALFVGDSYTSPDQWPSKVAQTLGWDHANVAIPGTGYTAANTLSCARESCPPYAERLAQVTEDRVDMVIIAGGRNDTNNPDEFRGAVNGTIDAAAAKYPDARIVLTTPIWDDDSAPESLLTKIAVIQDVAAQRGVTLVDLGQPLAGHPDFVNDDGIHPNEAGASAIADAFLAGWAG
jgi:lysophospholipase L1-like esterase